MVKEVLDGGKGNKGRKTLRWVSPEKVWNALKAKTPEEEYIANCEAEIKGIEEKIKNLKKEKGEKEKTFPKMKDSFVENLCLDELSKFLTDEELKLVKKWVERKRDLYERYEKTWSYKDELSKKLMKRLKTLDEDRKLVFAKYFSSKNILLFASNYGGFYYYSDDIYSNYREIQNNLAELWLNKYVRFIWDLCYNIDDLIVEKAMERVFEKTLPEDSKSKKNDIKKIDEEIIQLEDEKSDISKKVEAVERYWMPVEKALSILEWRESIAWTKDDIGDYRKQPIISESIDKENDVYVFLSDYSYYPWWWSWMEYWVVINVKRWDKTDSKKIVYRDAYSSSRDDWSLCYKRIDSVDIQPDKVVVHVSSNERKWEYTFDIKENEGVSLSEKEKKDFEKKYKNDVALLLSNLTRWNGKMPSNYDIIAGEQMAIPLWDRPYDKAEKVEEYCRFSEWIARVVIRAQIDANADWWKQFWRYKFEINPTWNPILLEYETAYQDELKGGKRIEMHAK